MNPVWIIAAIAVLFLIDVILFIREEYAWSVTIMVGAIAAAYYFMPDFEAFVKTAGWRTILTYAGVYVGAGIVTSLVKWVFFNLRITGEIKDIREKFDREEGRIEDPVSTMKSDLANRMTDFKPKEDLSDELNIKAYRRYKFYEKYKRMTNVDAPHLSYWEFHDVEKFQDALTPKAKKNVGKISIWIFQWPVVIIATVFDDILMKIGKWVSRSFDLLFSGISRHLVGKAVKDM